MLEKLEWKRVGFGVGVVAAAWGLGFAPSPARGEVEEIAISAVYEDQGSGEAWHFEIEIEGSGFISGSVDIPGLQARNEPLTVGGFGTQLSYEDPATSQGFASFAALTARNGTGDYTITLTDENGPRSTTLTWNPSVPVASGPGEPFVRTQFPQAGQTLGCGTPDVRYTLDCANCPVFIVDVVDTATFGGLVSYEYTQTGGPYPMPFAYSDFEDDGSPAPPLADGGYEVEVSAGFDTETTREFNTGPVADPFLYIEEASVVVVTPFTVANAQQDVQEVLIGAIREEQPGGGLGWVFDVEIESQNVCSVQLDIPGPMARSVRLGGEEVDEYELLLGPYADFAALQAENGPGTYSLLVNEAYTVDLVWNPTEPVAAAGQPFLALQSPQDGDTGVSATPDVDYDLACTNCDELLVEFFGLDVPRSCFFEGNAPFADPLPFSSLIEWDESGPCAPLDDGMYELEMYAGFFPETTENLTAGGQPNDPFDYLEEASLGAVAEIVVPEPSRALAAAAVLGALAGLRRRARGLAAPQSTGRS